MEEGGELYAGHPLYYYIVVWSQEIYEDGDSEWKQNKECFWTANNVQL